MLTLDPTDKVADRFLVRIGEIRALLQSQGQQHPDPSQLPKADAQPQDGVAPAPAPVEPQPENK